MPTNGWFFPAVVLTGLAAAGAGFGASHLWDSRALEQLKADRDLAMDCRHTGASVAPCPVIYRNTKIEWHDRIQTVTAPDRKQTERIALLSAELARAHHTIHNLERPRRVFRATAVYAMQNGSMQRPYNTYERCPPGSVVVYDADLSAGGMARRHSGNPDVCYVRTSLDGRLAFTSQHR